MSQELNELLNNNNIQPDHFKLKQEEEYNSNVKFQKTIPKDDWGENGEIHLRKRTREETEAVEAKAERKRKLPDKEFIQQPSLMTEMLQIKEYQGLYNLFIVITLNLTIYSTIIDLLDTGRINLGFTNIMSMFGKPWNVLTLLGGMHLTVLCVPYGLLNLWAIYRKNLISSKKIADLAFFLIFAIFLAVFFYVPLRANWADPLPPASAAIISLEQLRLMMKMYAFIRTNVSRVRNYDKNKKELSSSQKESRSSKNGRSFETFNSYSYSHTDKESDSENSLRHQLRPKGLNKNERKEEIASEAAWDHKNTISIEVDGNQLCPPYAKFLYFLFAPTLIYRDNYPRTKEIRWTFIVMNMIELLGCIYIYNLTHQLCGYVLLENYGKSGYTYNIRDLTKIIFLQMIPGAVGKLVGFFILLHNSQNIFAELLRFGDRMFYKDWWNSDSFPVYYRLWNAPIHDFLYSYVYREAKEAFPKMKTLPTLLVFILSSIFHEYVLIFVLRFFYPVLFVMFGGFGMLLAFFPNKKSRMVGNMFIWWALITGKGLLLFFYTMEYFARSNGCPPASSEIKDFFIPRSWNCGAINFY